VTRVEHRRLVYSYRWPWRVTIAKDGFAARFPWWGKPYKWLLRLFGVHMISISHAATTNIWAPTQTKSADPLLKRV
jgi:hypothetical protein